MQFYNLFMERPSYYPQHYCWGIR